MDIINVNEALKLIARARDQISVVNCELNDETLNVAISNLSGAIDKLVIPKPNCS